MRNKVLHEIIKMTLYIFPRILALSAQEIINYSYLLKVLSEVRELQPIPPLTKSHRLDLEIFHCDSFKQWQKYFTEMEILYS
jgi:hypothetical protein